METFLNVEGDFRVKTEFGSCGIATTKERKIVIIIKTAGGHSTAIEFNEYQAEEFKQHLSAHISELNNG
jgi:hypothetical protein